MTKVKITGIDKDIKNLRKRVFDAVVESKFENVLAREARAKIRKDGIGPDLEDSTKRFRNRVVSRKGPGYFVGKSSLTLSGQLLGALRSFFNPRKGFFGFFVQTGTHKPYRVQGRKKIYKTGGNAKLKDIFEGVTKKRPITKIFDDGEFKSRIERRLVSAIKRFIK